VHRRLVTGVILILGASATGLGGEAGKSSVPGQHLHLTFAERSPLSSLEEVCRRADYIDLQKCDAAT